MTSESSENNATIHAANRHEPCSAPVINMAVNGAMNAPTAKVACSTLSDFVLSVVISDTTAFAMLLIVPRPTPLAAKAIRSTAGFPVSVIKTIPIRMPAPRENG